VTVASIALPLLLLGWGGWRLNRAARAAAVADWGRGWLNWLDGLNRLICRRWHRLEGEGPALPASGGAIVVANHLSGLDPLLMIAVSRRPLHFMIATEEYHRYGLTWLFRAVGCIPVDRSARPERALRAAVRALEQGHVVALFPHGRIHRPDEPHHRLRPGARPGSPRSPGAPSIRSPSRVSAAPARRCWPWCPAATPGSPPTRRSTPSRWG